MQVSDQIIAVLDNLAQKFGIVVDWGQQSEAYFSSVVESGMRNIKNTAITRG